MKRLKTSFKYSTKQPKFSLPKKPRQTYTMVGKRKIKHGQSQIEIDWLKKLGVPVSSYVIKIPGNKIIITDGYDPRTNTVYEMLGDYFHKNPLKYKLDEYDNFLKKYNRELYYGTIDRFKLLHQLNYKIIFCWESQYKKGFLGRYYYYYDKTTNTWDNLL